jgi:hypothetical protein
MKLELQCKKCEESFHLDVVELQGDPEVKCPGCGAKAATSQVEALLESLDDLFASVAPLRRKFTVAIEVDSEDLPPPYDEDVDAPSKSKLLDEDDSDSEESLADEEELEEEDDDG